MKILMMTNTYFPIVGGLEQSIRSFSEQFRNLGHDVLIVAPTFVGPAQDEQYVIRLPALHNIYKSDFSINLPVPGLLPKIMKTFSPDIVHSHHPFLVGDYALRLSRQYHIPLVFTYHIMVEQYVHYLPVHNEQAKRFVVEIAAGYANLAHKLIVPTLSVQDILRARGVITPIEVIPTGINLKLFSKGNSELFRNRHQIPPGAFVIGYVGRLAPEKNLDFLAGCLVEFIKNKPSAHVLIAGCGPSQEMILNIFDKAGLKERLHLTGLLHHQDLIDAYFAMDVFAFASLSETQGVVLTEAMAAGVPVVALDAPGVREIVKNYSNGRLIDAGNQDNFIEAIGWIMNGTSQKRQSMKVQAIQTAQRYSITLCAKRMLNVYEELRSDENLHTIIKDNSWDMLKERLTAEWDIFKNILEAGEAALAEGTLKKNGRAEDENAAKTTAMD